MLDHAVFCVWLHIFEIMHRTLYFLRAVMSLVNLVPVLHDVSKQHSTFGRDNSFPCCERCCLSLSAKGQRVCFDHVVPTCDMQLIVSSQGAPVASAVPEIAVPSMMQHEHDVKAEGKLFFSGILIDAYPQSQGFPGTP